MFKPAAKAVNLSSQPNGNATEQPKKLSSVSYNVLYRKKSNKKHKTWEGDGVASLENGFLTVQGGGRRIASIKVKDEIEVGSILVGSNYEVEIEDIRAASRGTSSAPKIEARPSSNNAKSSAKVALQKFPSETRPRSSPKLVNPASKTDTSSNERESESMFAPFKPPFRTQPSSQLQKGAAPKRMKLESSTQESLAPAYDAFREPTKAKKNSSFAKNAVPDIDEVVLPLMRPHQIVGTTFLKECVLGKRHLFGNGAILADDMGLGKTLMAVALIYTLIKQGEIKNALVVCPVSLLRNWKKEFRKWLGETRLGVQILDQDANPKLFFRDASHKTYQVMVIGYERVYKLAALMAECNYPEFDLVVCDEGHRLKSPGSRLASSIVEVCGDRRVILSGTPVQNNLEEFWALCEFVNPGCLGTASKFARRFTEPIAAGKVPDAPTLQVEIAKERTEELAEITSTFMLRRDQSLLQKYLTVSKTEFVLFCRPTKDQLRVYREIIESSDVSNLFSSKLTSSNNAQFLQAITLLKQASNSLNISTSPRSGSPADESWVTPAPSRTYGLAASSSKLAVLTELLKQIHTTTDEKCVIVSGSTKVLDICQDLCIANKMQWLRLDGQTPQDRRQGIVDIFNKSKPDRAFAFLLSARSGGVGLNLIGASRLILFDCDWNPAIDSQAMARIHRDGQSRPTFVYRLLTTGFIDEKIFQRQLSKSSMSEGILYASSEEDEFTTLQLKDLFTVTEPEKCNTMEIATTKNYVEEPLDDVSDAPLKSTIRASNKISCVLRKLD